MTRHKVFSQISLLSVICAAAAAQTPVFTSLSKVSGQYPNPYWGLVQGLNGQLYSTTTGGGPGEVFEITTGGSLTMLDVLKGHSQTGLLLATDGNFYGATLKGGRTGGGKVFRVTPEGKYTELHSFCAQSGCPDGLYPDSPLIQGADGQLYGTTTGGGGAGCTVYGDACGTIYKMTLKGEITTLYMFCLQAGCLDGQSPYGAFIQTSDGSFYGTDAGGPGGEIYQLTPSGTLNVLHTFCLQSGCPDGSDPQGVVQGPDGALYGQTESYPTVWRLALDGTFQVLYTCTQSGCADGGRGPLISATDGNLYGTSDAGGAYGHGTIYNITTSGALTVLYNFCPDPGSGCKDGASPYGPLFQATDGNFYGTTFGGPANAGGPGTVFKLSMGLAPFVSPLPAHGKVGKRISILGTNLTGSTAVSFNGTLAGSFTVNSTGSAITTTVPAGATTGPIQVTLGDGNTLSSNVPFQVK